MKYAFYFTKTLFISQNIQIFVLSSPHFSQLLAIAEFIGEVD